MSASRLSSTGIWKHEASSSRRPTVRLPAEVGGQRLLFRCENPIDLGRRQRMAEREALQRVTAELGERHGMIFSLDAFRNHVDAECLADLDDRLDDAALLGGR